MKRWILQVLPLLLIVGGFALRSFRLGANSLWYDETVSLLLARDDVTELLRHTAGDIHPPLYYLLLHFWGQFAGWSEFSAAFLSLWFGVLLIALAYRIAREWLTLRAVAILAAFLVTVSPYNVWYSQEVRMYTVGATLGLLSVYFLRRMLAREKIFTRDFFAYTIFTALGFYTLYYFVFLVVFEWVWVAYCVLKIADRKSKIENRKSLQNALGTFSSSQLTLVALYLPWLAAAFRQATDPPVPPWREFIALPRVLMETWSALVAGQSIDPFNFAPFTLLLLIPIGALLWNARSAQFRIPNSEFRLPLSPWFLFAYTFIPLAAIYLFSLWKPLYHVRYMFTYAPAFYLLVAFALYEFARRIREWMQTRRDVLPKAAAMVATLAGIGFLALNVYSLNNFWFDEQYAEDDLRGAVNYIAGRWRPGDVILVNAGYAYPALAYYFPEPLERERLTNYQPTNEQTNQPLLLMTGSIGGAKNLGWGDPRSDFYATTADETRAALDRVFANASRVWMLRIYDTVVDPDGVIRKYFDEHATLLDDQAFTGESQTRVQGFITYPTRELPPNATRMDKALGERVTLVGYESGAHTLTPGAFLDAVLYWKLMQAVNYNYQVSLQLLDANGQNVAQVDETPLSELLPMTRWTTQALYREPLRLKIPTTLAVGEYHAIVKLYNPRSLEVLGEPVDLPRVTISP